MNPLEAALRKAASDLDQRGFQWAIVGGFAVSARSEPRFTQDVDIAAAVVDDSQAEALVQSLMATGYQFFASVEHDSGRLATVRLKRRIDGVSVVVDLLFASSGIEPEIVQAAESLEIFPGLVVPVARTGHLIALKLLARDDESRPQDSADLRNLAAVATTRDMADAAEAVRLIAERGFNRDRDLAELLADMPKPPSDV
ncbi:nucleotidyl transferase AbiEii/AbiGii toxin family protein [Nocardia uniformis]|uniref:Nucleotidyl transferase AbiEii/AbiGii toxin family protein n=1 Tax=Nocardia uniformis TaxID=53432 RepID=A0A849CA31_9NOCA|nr:nucleotidyl transferase AbiEii/AbiGii toxin family protein [Nocardia uniformis]NNH72787.1 nucleotidyl transferase AbiEii/AbiGii toxin family protein [Nocardia uniformis]